MSWNPEGESGTLIQKVFTRAREDALKEFTDGRKRIEHEQAHRGVMGGPVVRRCVDLAGAKIGQFATVAVAEVVRVLESTGSLNRDSTAWLRQTINHSVDAMVSGLGNQIDSLKTTGRFTGSTDLVRPFGERAKRDTDIAVQHIELQLKPVAPPVSSERTVVDVSNHVFAVALSFPGEIRPYVAQVAERLAQTMGPDACFYDMHYKAQLARPSLDMFLQDIYRRAKLVVAFICKDYEAKEWCGVEFRIVREIIKQRAHERVMYVRMDGEAVGGVLSLDGFVDGREHSPAEIADMARERALLVG